MFRPNPSERTYIQLFASYNAGTCTRQEYHYSLNLESAYKYIYRNVHQPFTNIQCLLSYSNKEGFMGEGGQAVNTGKLNGYFITTAEVL
jgi:hypothetical protein